jgi:ribonuclease J
VYATQLTRGLLELKLARNGLAQLAELHTVKAGESVQIGKVFKVEFFHVCHSIPDGVGLGIDTPAGLVVHTSDYKFDHTPVDGWPSDYAKLAEFSNRGVLALLSDSTNAERPGWTPSERVLDAGLEQVFSKAHGRILIATFASLISRMQQVANAASRHGRKLAFAGSSMVDNAKMARKLGYLSIPDSLMVPLEQALSMRDHEVVIMCTGSQGEPSSILGRLSTGTNRQFDVKPNDTVVLSSHPIPGNEETVFRTINRLFQRGAEVLYEAIAPVHVSGHASQEEIKLLIHLTKPQYVIPIHGELRMLKQHAKLAEQVGIPADAIAVVENGQVIELENGKMTLGERIPGGYVFVDGSRVGDVDSSVMREREALSRDGIVLVTLTIEQRTGRLMQEPEVITRGFIPAGASSDILAATRQRISETFKNSSGDLRSAIEQTVKSFLYNETKRRPMVFVTISRV